MYESIQFIKADDVLARVDKQVELLATAENGLERGYAHLGYLLLEVAEMQYWRIHFENFREYLESLATKYRKSAGSLQQYFLTVRDLSDTFSGEQLETMGITKAIQLRQAKDYALVLPSTIRDAALDPAVTVKQLKKLISTVLKLHEDEGDWMDLEAEFMVTPEERATIEDAINAARHCDPVTKTTISKSAQIKDVILKFAMEFLGAHAGEAI